MSRGLFLLFAIWCGTLAYVGLVETAQPHGWLFLLPFAVGATVTVLVREGLESAARVVRRRPAPR